VGSFISNLHVQGADSDAVIAALRKGGAVPAYVAGGPVDIWTSVYPQRGNQDSGQLQLDTLGLSKTLGRPVIAMMVHDSDVFCYWLADKGAPLDVYDSSPGYFVGQDTPPQGGRVEILLRYCRAGVAAHRLDALLHQKLSAADEAAGNTRPRTRLQRLMADQQARLDAAMAQHPERAAEIREAIRKQDAEIAASLATMDAKTGQADKPLMGSFLFIEPMMDELAGYLGLSPERARCSFDYLERGEGVGAMTRIDASGARPVSFPPAPASPP
jgi:hypothetical protein